MSSILEQMQYRFAVTFGTLSTIPWKQLHCPQKSLFIFERCLPIKIPTLNEKINDKLNTEEGQFYIH